MPTNAEFKCRVDDLAPVRSRLLALGPRFVGTDAQRDTYFCVPHGRLKLRQGTVETALIHYERADVAGVKRSDVRLYAPSDAPALGALLAASLGVDVVVEKTREIYFVGHVKIHLDTLAAFGTFVEVEAIDADGTRPAEDLAADAEAMRTALGLADAPLEAQSYSDLLRRGSVRGEGVAEWRRPPPDSSGLNGRRCA